MMLAAQRASVCPPSSPRRLRTNPALRSSTRMLSRNFSGHACLHAPRQPHSVIGCRSLSGSSQLARGANASRHIISLARMQAYSASSTRHSHRHACNQPRLASSRASSCTSRSVLLRAFGRRCDPQALPSRRGLTTRSCWPRIPRSRGPYAAPRIIAGQACGSQPFGTGLKRPPASSVASARAPARAFGDFLAGGPFQATVAAAQLVQRIPSAFIGNSGMRGNRRLVMYLC